MTSPRGVQSTYKIYLYVLYELDHKVLPWKFDLLNTSSLLGLDKTPLCLLGFECVEFERIYGAYACPWNPFDLPSVHFHS